jgi:hypothetical protein
MKNVLVGMLLASVFVVPAKADNNHQGSSGGSGGAGSGSAPTSSSTATANGGAGGAGGIGTGGSATGGTATGGTATGGTGGAATGGRSSASGNSSTVTVSLTNTGSGSGSSGSNGTASGSAAGDPNAATTVKYDGSYTVKSAPPIAAPSLTSTFSDTCMGSSSFGLSVVGFGATGGTTIVDEACVRRLDSREFRAMGLNDVALALLCQSPANRKAVEAAGRACPSASAPSDTAAATATTTAVVVVQPVQPLSSDRKDLAPVEPQASLAAPIVPAEAPPPVQEQPAAAAPQQASLASEATAEPVPAQEHAEAVEIKPVSDDVDVK